MVQQNQKMFSFATEQKSEETGLCAGLIWNCFVYLGEINPH